MHTIAGRIVPGLLVVVYVLCAIALATAWAQATGAPLATSDGDGDVLVEVYRAIIAGRWSWLAGFGLIVVIEPAKRWLLGRGWLRSDVGGMVLVFAASAVTGVASALLAGAAWNGTLALGIVRNAVVAAGGYTAIKRLILEQFAAGSKVAASLPTRAEASAPPVGSVATGTIGA